MAEDKHRIWVGEALARYERPLLRYASQLVGGAHAPDVVQDTFVALCRQPRSAVDGRLRAWLFTVCRNRAIDVARKVHRLRPATESQRELRCQDTRPDGSAETSQALERMRAALSRLPSAEREVLQLRLDGDLSYREIAEVTGRSVSHVGVLIHTAVRRLRRELVEPDAANELERSAQ